MATVLGLAMKITADASGMAQSLSPVDRALEQLSTRADQITSVFDRFAKASEGAANVQQQFAYQLTLLNNALKDGLIDAPTFAAEFQNIQDAAKAAADQFTAGAQIMEKYRSEQSKTADEIDRLTKLYDIGAIGLRELNAEVARITGVNEEAAASEKKRVDAQKALADEAAAIMARQITPQEEFNKRVARLDELQKAGLITEKAYNAELEQAAQKFAKATVEADKFNKETEESGKNNLKFNELSGILGLLPGQFGSIAARISSVASAGDGLGKLFAGGSGISGAISNVAGSLAGLVNPATLAAAGIAGVGAAAAAIYSGLGNLSGQVENLTNLTLRMGTSFQSIQVLDEAAKRSGTSVEVLAASMQRFSTKVEEARSGSGKAAKAFEELGISQEVLRSGDTAEIAKATADALLKIEDPAKRAALATDTLGKKGLSLLPAFKNVSDAEAAMKRFSATISDVDADRLNSLDDSFDNIKTALAGLGNNLLTPFAGLVEGLNNLIADSIGYTTNLIEPIGDLLTPLFDQIGNSLTAFGETINNVGVIIGKLLGIALTPLTNILKALGPALSPAQLAFQAINVVLEGLISVIDQAIAAWNRFADNIPLVGKYFKVATEEAQKGVGDIKADLEENFDNLSKEEQKAIEGQQKLVESVQATLNKAIDKSVEFGDAGFDAGVKYQDTIKRLQEQFDAGVLNETAFKRAAEQANAEFEAQIDILKQAADETKRKAEEERKAAEKLVEDNKKLADASIKALEAEQNFGGDSARQKAAESVVAIQKESLRVQEEINKAREAGDQAAVAAGTARLAKLDQAAARERDIASGAAAERKKAEEEEQKRLEERRKKEEQITKQIQDAEAKFSEKQAEIEAARIDKLSETKGGAVKVGDLRSSEGASTFLNLASGKMDPAIEEYRKQLSELKGMRKDIQKLESQKVEILAGNG